MTATVTEAPPVKQDLRCTTSRDDLLAALRHVVRAVPARPAVPVLAGVLVEAAGGALVLTGYDYDTHTRARVLAPGARGRALVPARELQRMLAVLDKGSDVALRVEKTYLRILGSGVHFTVPLLPLEDYPAAELPAPRLSLVAQLDAGQLQQLARACVAAGRDGTLPPLTGVLLEVHAGRLCATATDRYRLATVTGPVTPSLPDGAQALLPAAVLAYAATRWRKTRVSVRATTPGDEGWVSFESGPELLATRQIGGAYPKVRDLLSAAHSITAELDAAELQRAVTQVAVGVERHSPLRLRLGDGLLELRGGLDDDLSVAPTAAKDVPAEIAGEHVQTAFNPAYLLDGLRAAGGDRVRLGLQAPAAVTDYDPQTAAYKTSRQANKPMIVTNPDDEAFTYLVMPVRVPR